MFASQKKAAGKALEDRQAKKEEEKQRLMRIKARKDKIASNQAVSQGYYDRLLCANEC
jgi:hypothetical protein